MHRRALILASRRSFHTSLRTASGSQVEQQARPSIPLDPSLQDFLSQGPLPVHSGPRTRSRTDLNLNPTSAKSFDFTPAEDGVQSEYEPDLWEGYEFPDQEVARGERRSAEARFGSRRIGMVTLPWELEKAVSTIVQDSDKHQLRSDAKRLFLQPKQPNSTRGSPQYDNAWSTTKNPTKEKRVTPRDGLAYAAVAMPSHYAAIYSVLYSLRGRLGEKWAEGVSNVVEFGVGSGGGPWASLSAFLPESIEDKDSGLAQSTIQNYLGIENRQGLVSMAQKLLRHGKIEGPVFKFEKFWGKQGHALPAPPESTIALCAFTLSELPTDRSRRLMMREMWDTGADIMVIIDNGTKEGFKCVADAREYLLEKGRKEVKASAYEPFESSEPLGATMSASTSASAEGVIGSHVIAPCPHDGPCPLTLQLGPTSGPSSQICSFNQRLSRPAYTRKTKHATRGQEDTQYSYVIIRRGPRPMLKSTSMPLDIAPVQPIAPTDNAPSSDPHQKRKLVEVEAEGDVVELRHEVIASSSKSEPAAPTPDEDTLRCQSYNWPRIIYPPMKRSGHVILDMCNADGNISRHTYPKSQGKQIYYDARKSSWGDSFPWQGKNGPQIRRRGKDATAALQAASHDLTSELETTGAEEQMEFDGIAEGEYELVIVDGEMVLKELNGKSS